MDLEHGSFLKLEHFLPCWRFRPRWPGKHVHTETAGTFCSGPRLPDRKTSPEDGAARSGCHLLTAVYTHWPSPQGRSFKARAQGRGAQSARPWQARPAHRMQSFTMEFRRALETEVGVERKSPTDSHLSPGLLSHEPSPSQLRNPGGHTSSPPTRTGQTLHPCRAHTCFRRPQRESALW